MEKNQIVFFDTTLRDGEQTPGVNLNIKEKIEIAKQLEKLGVDVIEAGFPAASPGDFEAVEAVAKTVQCGVAALCRCVKADIDRGWEAVKHSKKPRIHVFLATSPIHMEYKLKMTPDEVYTRAVEQVAYAKTLCDDIEFSCEDASRSEPAFLYRVLEGVIAAGANTVNIPDTVGYAVPEEFGKLIKDITENVPNIDQAIISVHCHNDLGLAVANTLAAFENGARQAEVTINGIGERAGNCALEEVVMNLTTRKDYFGLTHNIETTGIYRSSQLVSSVTGLFLPACKAIVGQNAFSHESGIHQHGFLSNPLTYEIMTPESVGKSESTLVLGKLSGRHAFDDRLHSMGYELSKEELDDAFARFKELADRKKVITDEDLEALVFHKTTDEQNNYYTLVDFEVVCSKQGNSKAKITLLCDGKEITAQGEGQGPVDAAYSTLDGMMEDDMPLIAYDIKAVTPGEDALGEVTVRLDKDGMMSTGKGLSTDIIESSILAYINGVNRMRVQIARHQANEN